MRILSGVYWDQGKRAVNQDSVARQQVMTNRGKVLIMAVSDGIGGLQEGETASGYITEQLIEVFYKEIVSLVVRGKGKKALKKSMLRCFYHINVKLNDYGSSNHIQLGATVSLALIWGRSYMIFHLGDSRIYLFRSHLRKESIRLLTRDHSDGGSGLTKCMGSFPFQYPDIQFGRLHGKSGFLVCTDGFYRTMNRETLQTLSIQDIESEEQIYKRLKGMAAVALKKGEKDNLSAVYSMLC